MIMWEYLTEGYIQECWHPDLNNRPTADDIKSKIENIIDSESRIPTKILGSPDIIVA
ncbi:8659_t:CDS:2 [Funneliformis geosporum]|nr:8659_t:CDS:2 [Funneliformis geosporum]